MDKATELDVLWERLGRQAREYHQSGSRPLPNAEEAARKLREAIALYHDALDRHGDQTDLLLAVAQLLCDVGEDAADHLPGAPERPPSSWRQVAS